MSVFISLFFLVIIWQLLKRKVNSAEGSSPHKKTGTNVAGTNKAAANKNANRNMANQNMAYQTGQVRSAKDPHDNTHRHNATDHAQTVFAGNSYKGEIHNGKPAHALMEDRNNDWLAKQLREERGSLYRLKMMFGQPLERKTQIDPRF